MSSVENLKKISHIAYADGACKDNHLNASTVTRRAGSGFLVLLNTPEMLQTLQNVYAEYATTKNVEEWRLKLFHSSDEFQAVHSKAMPLPQPVLSPNKISNNRAELYAFICVLSHLNSLHQPGINAVVYLDSEYVIKVFCNAKKWKESNWKLSSGTKACNIDYVDEMLNQLELLHSTGGFVDVGHVPAHLNEKEIPNDFGAWCHWFGNDFVDRLSNIGAGVTSDINFKPLKVTGAKRKQINQ